jgi:hypothetical protein
VGEKPIGPDPARFLDQMHHANRLICVKTHQLPAPDAHKAIYVVRDGRAALVSHYHYLRDFCRAQTSLDDLIKGLDLVSWSTHVDAWLLSGRPNVLTVRYEDLVRGDGYAEEAIASFIGQAPSRDFDVSFSELRDLMPAFFRSGSNDANIAEMTAGQLELFERLHGRTLDVLGYPRMTAKAPSGRRMRIEPRV